jgi:hypothetical protein
MNPVEIIDMFILLVGYNFRYVVIILQTIEWHCMLKIIETQDKLDVAQIMFKVNIGTFATSTEGKSSFKFELGEKRWKIIYDICVYGFILIVGIDQGFLVVYGKNKFI